MYTKTLKKEKEGETYDDVFVVKSSSSHRRNYVISRFVTVVAIGLTKIQLAKFNWADDDCHKRPMTMPYDDDIGPRSVQ